MFNETGDNITAGVNYPFKWKSGYSLGPFDPKTKDWRAAFRLWQIAFNEGHAWGPNWGQDADGTIFSTQSQATSNIIKLMTSIVYKAVAEYLNSNEERSLLVDDIQLARLMGRAPKTSLNLLVRGGNRDRAFIVWSEISHATRVWQEIMGDIADVLASSYGISRQTLKVGLFKLLQSWVSVNQFSTNGGLTARYVDRLFGHTGNAYDVNNTEVSKMLDLSRETITRLLQENSKASTYSQKTQVLQIMISGI
jgi:hypothetical protein